MSPLQVEAVTKKIIRFSFYVVFVLLIEYYVAKFSGWTIDVIIKQTLMSLLPVISEVLRRKNKIVLSNYIISFMIFIFSVQVLWVFIFNNIYSLNKDISMWMYLLHKNYLLHAQHIYMCLLVHFSVYHLLKYDKEPPQLGMKFFIYPSLLISLIFPYSIYSFIINIYAVVMMIYAKHKIYGTFMRIDHRKMMLLFFYFCYSMTMCIEAVGSSMNFSEEGLIYPALLLFALFSLSISEERAVELFFNRSFKVLIAFIFVIVSFFENHTQFLLISYLIAGLILLTIKYIKISIWGIKIEGHR